MKEQDNEELIENENKNENNKEKDITYKNDVINDTSHNQNDDKNEKNKILQNNNHNQNKKEEKENTILLVKSKINELKENYNFYRQYHDILFNMINYLEKLAYEKISNSINDSFNYLTFFETSSEIYSKFAEQIKQSNDIIMSSKKLPKMNDNFLLEIMQNTQNIIYLNLSKISNGLKNNIISKGPFSKFQEKIKKIDSIKRQQIIKYYDIEEKKKNLEKKYEKKYSKLFYVFSQDKEHNNKNNINNDELNISLIDYPDLICIIKDLLDDINKIIVGINLYVIDTKDALYSINHLFVEINDLIRDSVLIYIQESKNNFNIDVTKNFEKIQNYYKKLDENPEDKMFKLEKIFNEQKNKEKIFDLLEKYYNLLNNSGRIKKELIFDRNNFSIRKYSNIYLFFEWLISISPQPTQINIDDLIIKKLEIKRYSGFLRGWKDSIMIYTKQNHLILYEKPISYNFENIIQIFEIDKTNFNKKVDFKKPFLFEITVKSKGKIMDFYGTFLFDALNNENLYDISMSYKDYINK